MDHNKTHIDHGTESGSASAGLHRRTFLKMAALGLGSLALSHGIRRCWRTPAAGMITDELTPTAYNYLPLITRSESTPTSTHTPTPTATPTATPTNTPGPTCPPPSQRVVHVHSTLATHWDFGDDYYGNFVDQPAVDAMVDEGVIALTGASSLAQAWQTLLPGYAPGKAIAIKVNLNNSLYCEQCTVDCEEWRLKIDALVHPINGIIRGLKVAYPNFAHNDVWVFDASPGPDPPVSLRKIPDRFIDACPYAGVRYFDQGCCEPATFATSDPSAWVSFYPPAGTPLPPAQKITDVLVAATYVINIPILKRHGGAGVSLSFKNHFGSIDNCPPLHDWTCFNWPAAYYSSSYNPLVDLYLNPHIGGKTVLTIGDGLFGDRIGNVYKPSPWETFGDDAPNSLFFSTDPVALDCVMCDFLNAEGYQGGIYPNSDDYLRLAAAAGLGTFERGDPWGAGYSIIDYEWIEL
ncbi:MAG: DUF362 domain-containing protein [Anaerolineae bacterium]|nr:DUF362 domain-containing protein [Anaerolineae bacterium]